ncbi:hypothetical protein, partial [Anabaena sp. PCC 7938]|uniref:hypothetical protein n=1 Tax=Anabaena sp. PCC 7938 TaxID=1296340 RepID=UPI0020345E6C
MANLYWSIILDIVNVGFRSSTQPTRSAIALIQKQCYLRGVSFRIVPSGMMVLMKVTPSSL